MIAQKNTSALLTILTWEISRFGYNVHVLGTTHRPVEFQILCANLLCYTQGLHSDHYLNKRKFTDIATLRIARMKDCLFPLDSS